MNLLPPENEVWCKVIFPEASLMSIWGGGPLYDVIFCLAAWSHVPSRGLCPWSRVPGGSLCKGLCLGSLSRESPYRDTPPPQIRKVGGMHPTGMLSYLKLILLRFDILIFVFCLWFEAKSLLK